MDVSQGSGWSRQAGAIHGEEEVMAKVVRNKKARAKREQIQWLKPHGADHGMKMKIRRKKMRVVQT